MAEHPGQIDAFWVSPYVRARETLTIALMDEASVSAPRIVDERLRDRELGILDLMTRAGVERLHPGEAERRRHLGKFYHRPPGGESWADVALRLRSFLRDALPGPAESAMIVAHDAVVILLLYVLLPLDETELLDFAAGNTVHNASITHLRFAGKGWELVDFSSVGHLERVGAPVTEHAGSPDVQPPDSTSPTRHAPPWKPSRMSASAAWRWMPSGSACSLMSIGLVCRGRSS